MDFFLGELEKICRARGRTIPVVKLVLVKAASEEDPFCVSPRELPIQQKIVPTLNSP